MKKIFLLIFLAFFSCFSYSQELPEKSKVFLLNNLPTMFGEQFKAPEIQACWNQGLNGNDRALSALFVIYKGAELVQQNADNTKQYFRENMKDGKFTGKISEMLAQRDYNKLKKVVKLMPRAIKYCEGFLPKEASN